jgi:hypothetical protein
MVNEEYLKKSEENRRKLKKSVKHELKMFRKTEFRSKKYILSDEQKKLIEEARRYYRQKIFIPQR